MLLRFRWIVPVSSRDPSMNLCLSPSACEMLLVLRDHLHQTSQLIADLLFKKFWQNLVEKLDHYLYNEVRVWDNFLFVRHPFLDTPADGIVSPSI